MYEKFVKERIYTLVESQQISERKLSLSLGRSEGYIHQITSYNSSTLPSMEGLFDICRYFNMTPGDFFANDGSPMDNPLVRQLAGIAKDLSPRDLELLISIASRLSETEQEDK